MPFSEPPLETVILSPAERKAAVREAFEDARHSLTVGMFRWEDDELLGGLERACRRGVRARVLLSQRAKGWVQRLGALERRLEAIGVEVRRYQTKASKYHAKYVVADDRLGLVSSFNFTPRDLERTCDFGLLTRDGKIAQALARLFEADWEGRELADAHPSLLVMPGEGRQRIRSLILAAGKSIAIVDHRMWSPDMLQMLGHRAAEGVAVRVLGPEHAETERSILCRKPSGWMPHGKLMIVDHQTAVLGSISPITRLLDHRRELSIATSQPASVQKLSGFFEEMFHGEPAAAGRHG